MYLPFFFPEIVESPESSLSVAGNFLTDLGLDVIKTEGEETSVGLSDVQLPPDCQVNGVIIKIKPVVNEDTFSVINSIAFKKNVNLSFHKSGSSSDNNTF